MRRDKAKHSHTRKYSFIFALLGALIHAKCFACLSKRNVIRKNVMRMINIFFERIL